LSYEKGFFLDSAKEAAIRYSMIKVSFCNQLGGCNSLSYDKGFFLDSAKEAAIRGPMIKVSFWTQQKRLQFVVL